jgi:hypothetical protein
MSRPTHDARRSAAWLCGEPAADARFHTAPLGPSHPALTGFDLPGPRRGTGILQGGEDPPPATSGLDRHDQTITAHPHPIADPTAQLFPDTGGPAPSAPAVPTDDLPAHLQAALAGLHPELRSRVLTTAMAGRTGHAVSTQVQRNLETVVREVLGRLHGPPGTEPRPDTLRGCPGQPHPYGDPVPFPVGGPRPGRHP